MLAQYLAILAVLSTALGAPCDASFTSSAATATSSAGAVATSNLGDVVALAESTSSASDSSYNAAYSAGYAAAFADIEAFAHGTHSSTAAAAATSSVQGGWSQASSSAASGNNAASSTSAVTSVTSTADAAYTHVTSSASSSAATGWASASASSSWATTSSTTSSASAATSSAASGDCSCGYVLTDYANTYFPYATVLDMSSLASISDLTSNNFVVNPSWQVGAVSSAGDACYGSADNVKLINGVLELVMPGGQSGLSMTCAEVHFGGDAGMTGGVFTTETLIDGTNGTCQAMFTYHTGDGVDDEQDIEILTAYIDAAGPNGTPAGIELTNWDPTDASHQTKDSNIVTFPSAPTAAYHKYTIAWLDQTTYYVDGQALDGPSSYVSVNPSKMLINNWSNGGSDFTYGPPASDSVMRVKSVAYYYKTAAQDGLLSGCSLSDACQV